MMYIRGIEGSPGVVLGRAWVVTHGDLPLRVRDISRDQVDSEWSAFEAALDVCETQIKRISSRIRKNLGPDEASIFEAQLVMLRDPAFKASVRRTIESGLVGADVAVRKVSDEMATVIERLSDPYLSARAADVRDLARRILFALSGQEPAGLASVPPGSVVVASDLTPSDTALMDRKNVRGIVLDAGGPAAHATIIARSMGIPAVVGTKSATSVIRSGQTVAVDGTRGQVYVDPSEEVLQDLSMRIDLERYRNVRLWSLRNLPGLTIDNRPVKIAANIQSPRDIPGVISAGAEAVGLYRTEFLFIGRQQAPGEDEQYEAYRSVLEQMSPRPVVIRTLDAGGDKRIPYLSPVREVNPALGVRGIRLSLRQPELFITQLRALVRAASHGHLGIMFPVVSGLSELRRARAMLDCAREQLRGEGVDVRSRIDVGIMVEVPSAALMASVLARQCDFLSIGTNDLVQYTCAADRESPDVESIYEPFDPAVLHLLNRVIQAGHRAGIWVGVCGEMAGTSLAIPLLVGMGVDELSVSTKSVPRVKDMVRRLWADALRVTVEHALGLSTGQEVREFLREQFQGIMEDQQ